MKAFAEYVKELGCTVVETAGDYHRNGQTYIVLTVPRHAYNFPDKTATEDTKLRELSEVLYSAARQMETLAEAYRQVSKEIDEQRKSLTT